MLHDERLLQPLEPANALFYNFSGERMRGAMTEQDLNRFVAQLRSDDGFAIRFKQRLSTVAEERALVGAAVGFAEAAGFAVGPEAMAAWLEASRNSSRELSDDDLDAVTGGALPHWSNWVSQRRQWE